MLLALTLGGLMLIFFGGYAEGKGRSVLGAALALPGIVVLTYCAYKVIPLL